MKSLEEIVETKEKWKLWDELERGVGKREMAIWDLKMGDVTQVDMR